MFFKEFPQGHEFWGGQGVDWSMNGFHTLFNIDLKVIGCSASVPAFSPENTLQNSWYSARMLSRILVAIACDGLRLVMDITKVGVPRSLQSLVIVMALTMQMSIFLLLASSFFGFFGSLNVILVSIQSMFGLCQASQS